MVTIKNYTNEMPKSSLSISNAWEDAYIENLIKNNDYVEMAIAQLDSQLIQNHLSPAMLAEALARRKQLIMLMPCPDVGAMRKQIAEKLEISTRAIIRLENIGMRLDNATLQEVAGTSLDRPDSLAALVHLPRRKQQAYIQQAKSGQRISIRSLVQLAQGYRCVKKLPKPWQEAVRNHLRATGTAASSSESTRAAASPAAGPNGGVLRRTGQ